ncbi:hypothetical protein X741_27400 [Mesorhizobium sp. LNHC229A00]|nr:hypothetical protein X741_27400 [Mesorhizobium sp. LNHC229A00]
MAEKIERCTLGRKHSPRRSTHPCNGFTRRDPAAVQTSKTYVDRRINKHESVGYQIKTGNNARLPGSERKGGLAVKGYNRIAGKVTGFAQILK